MEVYEQFVTAWNTNSFCCIVVLYLNGKERIEPERLYFFEML